MARTKKSQVAAKVWELRHLGQRDIAKQVGCSLGLVNTILAEPPPAASPPPPTSSASTTEEKPDVGQVDTSPIACFERAARDLEHAASEARSSGDVARLIAAAKAATAVATAATKLPKPEPTADERTEVIAAAKRVREKLHDLFDRLLAEVPT